MSDGKPSEKNRNENIDYSGVNDKATPIKAKGASLYTIGFGPEYATVPNPIKMIHHMDCLKICHQMVKYIKQVIQIHL